MAPYTFLMCSLVSLMVLGLGYSAPVMGPSMVIQSAGLFTLRCLTEDWTLVDDYCYYATNETVASWSDASDLCWDFGAELVSVLGSPDGIREPFSVQDLVDAEVVQPGMRLWIAQNMSFSMNSNSQSGGSSASTSTTARPPTVCPYVTVGSDGMAKLQTTNCAVTTMSTVCVTVPNVSMSIMVTSANASDYNTGADN